MSTPPLPVYQPISVRTQGSVTSLPNDTDAFEYLTRAAQQSGGIPSSPDSANARNQGRRASLSPIRRVRNSEPNDRESKDHLSDEEANLVVIENPDGSLLEGMPSGFKHLTPEASVPHTPRTLNFALTGVDLVDLFDKHERIFLVLLLVSVFADAVIITEEFTTVLGALLQMQSRSHGEVQWSSNLGSILPFMDRGSDVSLSDTRIRQTFSVFPPHWTFTWAFACSWIDLLVCLLFFMAGFFAYVSKQRRAYTWFSTIACVALVWQVLLSCVDKLSLILFLVRLACFTHARFMGDLMDDIAVLATLFGVRSNSETQPLFDPEQEDMQYDTQHPIHRVA